MKKSSLTAMVLGTVSGVLFALGICMALIPEWEAFVPGIICGCVGLLLGIITLVSIQSYFIREFQAISMSLQPGMTGGTQHTIALYALSARLSHVGLFILFGFICFRQGLGKSFSGAVLIINSAQQLIGFGVFWERLLL